MCSVVSEQLQGERCILDVAIRQQKQVPDATGRRQQAESSQGSPQLSAAPYWRQVLEGIGVVQVEIVNREYTQVVRKQD